MLKKPMKLTFDLNEGQSTGEIFYDFVSLINSMNTQSQSK